MGLQAFLAENLLCALQPFDFAELTVGVIKKGVSKRPCFGLENQGLFLASMPIIYAFLFDQQNE